MPGVTMRGLQEGFETTPLRKFKGRLDDYPARVVQTQNWGEQTRVELQFQEVEVIESTEPYHFPIAQLSIKYSDKKNSTWGIFATSCTNLMPEDFDISDLKGKFLTMQLTPGHEFGKDKETDELIVRDCWECVEIEGMAGGASGPQVSATRRALEHLHQHTEQDFNQAVFQDPLVKGDADLTGNILNRTFLTAMESNGVIAKQPDETWKVDWEKAPA